MKATATLTQQAANLSWGIAAGLDTVVDAVAWADRMLADPNVSFSYFCTTNLEHSLKSQ
jgi:hypothetical protein